jgi:hypothetical protein
MKNIRAKYSLSEIDAECKKAARGCGFSWGSAEEIGKAIRWLVAYDFQGVVLLVDYLTQRDQKRSKYQQLVNNAQTIQPENNDDILCPLLVGSYICDHGLDLFQKQIEFKSLAYPLLLLPYLSQLTFASDNSLEFRWGKASFYCAQGKILRIETETDTTAFVDSAFCEVTPLVVQGELPVYKGHSIEKEYWQRLSQFSHRIYVPASEASRKGAGPS